MRIAILDLLFSWPPHGGADVDVYYVTRGLRTLGHDAQLFVAREAGCWERGRMDPSILPFPATLVDFAENAMSEDVVTSAFLRAMNAFSPNLILLTQGYFLKTALILALREHRVVSRCYAHETACHKDILRFRDGAPCPCAYARTPERCRRCALEHLGADMAREQPRAWTREYLAARAWTPDYYHRFTEAMNSLHGVIITTDHMREQVQDLCSRVFVIPHGVDVTRFTPPSERAETVPVLFVPGRVEDPAKGFSTFLEAGERLAAEGYAFTAIATLPEGFAGPAWLKALGKRAYEVMPECYRNADICVVPSLWDEPFGLVALEAMASAVPVVAARVGGLQALVEHGETGLLFERGDAADLAGCLRQLIAHPEAAHAMGRKGRQHVVDHCEWDALVSRYYPPLLR